MTPARRFLLAGVTGISLGLVTTTQVAGPLIAQEVAQESSVYEQLDLFGDIFERIRTDYVEEVDDKALIEAAINGMLISLDPHSGYLSAEAAAEMRVETSGEFGGLGLEVTQEEGWVKVITPMDGTPAQAAGMQPGDFITAVNGETLLGLTLEQAIDLLKGPPGSEVVVTVVREGAEMPFDVSIIRDVIQVTAVRARTEGRTAVLRITTFSDQTFADLQEGLAAQIAAAGGIDNIDGVILDLRNNPGGLLSQAIYVADAFLDAGEIVSTRGREEADSDRYNAEPGDLAMGKPIVVLINGGSASASEIVAGALQDHRRAIVVGTQSFGKGSVQTLMPLQGDAAMRLTTARYYTPSGRSIQALGISPDIIVQQPIPDPVEDSGAEEPVTPQYRTEADLRGALDNDSLTEEERRQLEEDRARAENTAALREEDYQLAYAIDILRGLNALAPACRNGPMTPDDIAQLPYRPCVGIMLANPAGLVFVGQRRDNHQDAWQMPQGGIDADEEIVSAALRELWEETGIRAELVQVVAQTAAPVPYDLPVELVPRFWGGRFRGQAQTWVLMRYLGRDDQIDIATVHPEFSAWKWVTPKELVPGIVSFKRAVYARVVDELGPLI